VEAAEGLDERLLVLLFVRKAEPASLLAELLGEERGPTTTALGRLSQRGLVSHHRPEGEPSQWFATREGRTRAEQLHRTIAARLASASATEPLPEAPPAAEPPPAEAGDHTRVKARRRVSIDQNEKTGFSWD
jgi:DNA-binding MarR family transcriptional regulator